MLWWSALCCRVALPWRYTGYDCVYAVVDARPWTPVYRSRRNLTDCDLQVEHPEGDQTLWKPAATAMSPPQEGPPRQVKISPPRSGVKIRESPMQQFTEVPD